MKHVIIAGYPKSGNTWVTRLTAELIGCSVVGFWNSEHKEIAREGEDRVSEFQCFKSHHQLHELQPAPGSQEQHIIYVVRDPRDVAVSGANYFRFGSRSWTFRKLEAVARRLPAGLSLLRTIENRVIYPERFRIDQVVQAVLHGSRKVHYWCAIPWREHYRPFLDAGILFVKYEDLLVAPERECRRILFHLGLARSDDQIERAIGNQSFEKKKEEFISREDGFNAAFLRVGKSGQWKEKLSDRQKELFRQLLGADLERFSYSLDEEDELRATPGVLVVGHGPPQEVRP